MGVVVFSHLGLLLDVPLVGLLDEATPMELGGVLHLLGHQFPLGLDPSQPFVCEIAVNLHLVPTRCSPPTSLSGWGTTSSWSRTWGSLPLVPPTLGTPPCSFTPSPALGFGYYNVCHISNPLCFATHCGTWRSLTDCLQALDLGEQLVVYTGLGLQVGLQTSIALA